MVKIAAVINPTAGTLAPAQATARMEGVRAALQSRVMPGGLVFSQPRDATLMLRSMARSAGWSRRCVSGYPSAQRCIVEARAGTAISHRVRAEPNAYNYIRLDRDLIEIMVRRFSGERFAQAAHTVFTLEDGVWVPRTGEGKTR